MRECRKCFKAKPLTKAHWERSTLCKDGYRRTCRACRAPAARAHSQKFRDRNPEAARAIQATYRKRNPHLVRAKFQRWAQRPENRIKRRAIRKRHRIKNHEKVLTYERLYREKHRQHLNATQQSRRYGLSITQHSTLLKAQDGRCAICLEACKSLHIDHDHATMLVRGLLCSSCNTGLGRFKDNVKLLLAAKAYLEKWRS